MNRGVRQALAEVDVVFLVVEAGRFDERDRQVRRLVPADRPLIIVVSKIDQLPDKTQLLPFLARLAGEGEFTAIVPVSATRGDQLEVLLAEARKHLPNEGLLFAEDDLTDRSERFLAAEYIREKVFRLIGDELPYAVAVEIERFVVDGGLRRISAAILVDREGHKPIVVGRGGEVVKRIATEARHDMERLFGGPVFLEVFVKLKSGWADDERLLQTLGYD